MPPKRRLADDHSVKRIKTNEADHSSNKSLPFDDISVDIPDIVDRIQNGNQFEEGFKPRALNGKVNDDEVGFELFGYTANANSEVGSHLSVGKVGAEVDGIGVCAHATGVQAKLALGPVDLGTKIGSAGAGYKVWEPEVGLDAGFHASANAVEVNLGPVGGAIGIGIDSNVKLGKEGVGLKVLGTGVEIGRTIGFSLFGSGVSIKLW